MSQPAHSQLMERLLELEEKDMAATSPIILGHNMHCLSLFCAAKPTLLLPHVDVRDPAPPLRTRMHVYIHTCAPHPLMCV